MWCLCAEPEILLSKEAEVGAAEHLTFAGFDAQISAQTEHVLIARGGLPESPGTTSAFSWIIPSSGSGDGGASLVAHGDGLVRHGALARRDGDGAPAWGVAQGHDGSRGIGAGYALESASLARRGTSRP